MTAAQKPPTSRLYLFNSFRLERPAPSALDREDLSTQILTLPTRKVESLLAYLVLHPGPHPREKLAALFWGDSSDQDARTSLRRALSLLRLHLASESLIADRQTIQLNPEFHLWVDVREFEQSAKSRLSKGVGERGAYDEVRQTLALYRGDLLVEFYDDWIPPEREHLRGLYLELLSESVQASRAASQYERAIEFAQQILTADPANERAYQHLMFCFVAIGNRQAALEQYEQCRRALQEELAVEPAAETLALYDWIRSSPGEAQFAATRITNLPIPISFFIGRQSAMGELKGMLRTGDGQGERQAVSAFGQPHSARLVSLLGAGGSGKTRLAIQVATDLVDAFQDGVWWIELAGLTNGALVPQAVAKGLGVQGMAELSLIDNLSNFLYAKKLLLVLDNCEHLVEACAQLAEHLLSRCADLKILTTSREALGVSGEVIKLVPPLSLPEKEQISTPKELQEYEAIQLFVERAFAVKPDFALKEENSAAVTLVCQRLDGIPLAIELAAARVKLLSVEQIAARLDDRFHLLTGGSRTALPRQQTLKATIDWSYDLLPPDAQVLMRRLAVFAGGFTLQAVESIFADSRANSLAALDLLSLLVDRSLLSANYQGRAERYGMLETLREYARERLAAAGEIELYCARHLDFFLQMAERAESELGGPKRLAWFNQLEAEHDNLNVALSTALLLKDGTEKLLRLTAALYQFWVWRGHWREGGAWAVQAVAASRAAGTPSKQLHVKALNVAGIILVFRDWREGNDLIEECVALAREVDDKPTLAHALLFLGINSHSANDDLKAAVLHTESLALLRAIGDEWWLAYALGHMGNLLVEQGDYARARVYYQESILLLQNLGDVWTVQLSYFGLGKLSYAEGDYDRALEFLKRSEKISIETGDRFGTAVDLHEMGLVAMAQGRDEYARTLLEQGLKLFEMIGFKRFSWTVLALGLIALKQGEFTRAAPYHKESLVLMLGKFPPRSEDLGFLAYCVAGLSAIAEHLGARQQAAQLLGGADRLIEAAGHHIRPLDRGMQAEYEHLVRVLHQALDGGDFAEIQMKGRALTQEQIVALALES